MIGDILFVCAVVFCVVVGIGWALRSDNNDGRDW
jgi:heme/copper-type cytochrome/quinol oxidase subunit 4